MSMCYLRSMSPLHLQYLKNMGVTCDPGGFADREGQLWGLIACHHYAPRNLTFAGRSAADLLGEVIATRLAAIENYAHAQVAIQVRRLEQRLVEATSTEGDWRFALFRNPRTLLQPLEATGAALFHDGELLTAGEVPSTAEMRALQQWIDAQRFEGPFHCSSVARANPALDPLTPTASGVLAVRLFASSPDFLMWFRKEQLQTVTWAGDPSKPAIGNDPQDLSPRRSFAAWSEIVRGTALPWSTSELALARAFGAALIDIIVQVNAVRLLIAEHQLGQIRATVGNSNEPVVIADPSGRTLFANTAFQALLQPLPAQSAARTKPLDDLPSLFTHSEEVRVLLGTIGQERRPWRGDLALALDTGAELPVSVRAEVVPARDGSILGFFLIFDDLTDSRRAAAARQHLEQSLASAIENAPFRGEAPALNGERRLNSAGRDDLFGAILANASLAAMDIADGSSAAPVVPLLEELEASTRRATTLYGRIRNLAPPDRIQRGRRQGAKAALKLPARRGPPRGSARRVTQRAVARRAAPRAARDWRPQDWSPRDRPRWSGSQQRRMVLQHLRAVERLVRTLVAGRAVHLGRVTHGPQPFRWKRFGSAGSM
jgi:PAS domain-containing protein